MTAWIAGNAGPVWREEWVLGIKPERLFSYHIITTNMPCFEVAKTMKQENKSIKLFLDSGAFSAKTQGIEIDIDTYIAFIKENLDVLEVYANLDVIGDPAATLENQKYMEKAGLKPLPTFHKGEPVKFLKYYIDNYDYIALGGLVGGANSDRPAVLDHYFSDFICKHDGYPRVKVHGFGMTSLDLIWRYPWYSVDSTSWVMSSRTGSIMIPQPDGKGGYNYRKKPWLIDTSIGSPTVNSDDFHLDNMSPLVKKEVMIYLNRHKIPLGVSEIKLVDASFKPDKEAGQTWHGKPRADGKRELQLRKEEGVRNHYKWRDYVNVLYYRELEKAIPAYPRKLEIKAAGHGFDLGL